MAGSSPHLSGSLFLAFVFAAIPEIAFAIAGNP
jgi:hypothetical protein